MLRLFFGQKVNGGYVGGVEKRHFVLS
jgi:hypothetical protein